jgi:hypothetical protein
MEDGTALTRARRAILYPLFSILFLLATSGCSVFGIAAQALPPATITPVYEGLREQTVGVMVWVDRGLRMDYPPLQIDIANATQLKLIKSKAKHLKGSTFPVKPASIVKFQQDYPELEAESIADVAPRLGVSRLIYIELEDFSTRSQGSVELFRGSAEVTLRVIEVKDGVGKVAYEENGVAVTFPEKVPAEGIPNASDRKIYIGTVDALSTALARKFVPYVEER